MHFVLALLLAVVLGSPILAQSSKEGAIAKADAILKNLQDDKAAEIAKELDSKLMAALPEEKLKGVWAGLVSQFGAFKNVNERREGRYQGRQAVELILAFEKQTIVMRTVFDGEGKVGGLVFRPLDMAVLPAGK
jgi:Protein of unknown function (DUF3887)